MNESLVEIIKNCQNLSKDKKIKYLTEQLYECLSIPELTRINYVKMQKIIIELAKTNFNAENVNIYFANGMSQDFFSEHFNNSKNDLILHDLVLKKQKFLFVENDETENLIRLVSLFLTLAYPLYSYKYTDDKNFYHDIFKKMAQEQPERAKHYHNIEMILSKNCHDKLNKTCCVFSFPQQISYALTQIAKKKFPKLAQLDNKHENFWKNLFDDVFMHKEGGDGYEKYLNLTITTPDQVFLYTRIRNLESTVDCLLKWQIYKLLEDKSIELPILQLIKKEFNYYSESLQNVSTKCGNLSKEEQLTYLASKIWSCLHLTDYDNLQNEPAQDKKTFTKNGVYVGRGVIIRNLIVKFLQTFFEAQDVPVLFQPGLKGVGGFDPVTEKIYLASDVFSFYDSRERDINNYGTIANLLITLSHEITHAKDFFENGKNLVSKDFKNPTGRFYENALGLLGTFFPKNAKKYEDLGKALYTLANNELRANAQGFSCALCFVELLNKLTDQIFPEDTIKKYSELETAITFIKGKTMLLEDEINEEKELCFNSIKKSNQDKTRLLPEAKKDFLKACKKIMTSQQPDKNIADNFALLIRKPEFFDKPTAQKFYEWGKENNLPSVYGALCYVSELDIPDAERKSGEKKYAQIIENEKNKLKNQEKNK